MLKALTTFVRRNAIALLALFVALGGTSYAALSLPASSVGTKQLRNGAVTGRKLAKRAVSAASLDPKSIAGHVADWAQISAAGRVTISRPSATVSVTDPTRGLFRISWHRSIPPNCVAFANPANVPTVLGRETAETFGPAGHGASSSLLVETYDAAGNNVPETVNVMVLCP